MRRVGIVAAIAALAGLLVPAIANAQGASRQSAELRFTESDPATSTGFTLDIDYVNPRKRRAKPPAVRRVVERFASGARIDTSVPARCTASDLILILRGAAACPAGSRVGVGTIVVDTGLPLGPARFLTTDVLFLNNTDQLIFLVTERITGARLVFRSSVAESRIVSTSPFLPGMLPDGSAIDVVHARIAPIAREIGGVRRAYVTTPPECPVDGAWTNSIDFTYADGVRQTTTSRSPCSGSGL